MTTNFEQEIRSQGSVLAQRAETGREQAQRVAQLWRGVSYAVAAARGSSDNGAVFFQYLAGEELGLLVALATPSLFEGKGTIGLDGAGVLAISQSGRTPASARTGSMYSRRTRPKAPCMSSTSSPICIPAKFSGFTGH